jgi:hypothetical protein
MAEALVQVEIEAPVDALWRLVSSFGEIDWMQGISKVEVKGSGVGMVRQIYAAHSDVPVVEVLESVDEDARRIGYTIPENIPLPVDDYHASCTAVDLGNGRSRLDWGCQFTPMGMDEASAKAQVEAMYNVLISWVKGELEG